MYVSTPKYSYFISPIVPLKQVTGFQNVPFVFTYHVTCLRSQIMRNRVACIVINNYANKVSVYSRHQIVWICSTKQKT